MAGSLNGRKESGLDKMAKKSQMRGEEMVKNQKGGKKKIGKTRRTKPIWRKSRWRESKHQDGRKTK